MREDHDLPPLEEPGKQSLPSHLQLQVQELVQVRARSLRRQELDQLSQDFQLPQQQKAMNQWWWMAQIRLLYPSQVGCASTGSRISPRPAPRISPRALPVPDLYHQRSGDKSVIIDPPV